MTGKTLPITVKESYRKWLACFCSALLLVILVKPYANASQIAQYTQDDTALVQLLISETKEIEELLITIKIEDMNLADALEILADQLRVGISYNSDLMPNKKVTLDMDNVPVFEVLYKLFEGTNLEPVVPSTRDVIVIREKERFLDTDLLQQTVTGRVIDAETGEALPGVNVIAQLSEGTMDTPTGTTTNVDGEYELTVSDEVDILVFSYIGYQRQEISINGRSEINIEMAQDVQMLEDLVVVGYGTQNERDLTGAIGRVSADDLNQGAVQSSLESLAGRSAGVSIIQTNNEPGSTPQVRIRGLGSFDNDSNDPLFVVDGVQGEADLLNQVPTSEIQSFEILKGPSATAIYGSRGAAGVILVTTKSNQDGNFSVSYDGSVSFDYLANRLEILDAQEWRATAEQFPGVGENADNNGNTDWYDLLTRRGMTQNHTISFGGGSDNFNYRASVSGILQKGLVLSSNNDTYVIRAQATQDALEGRLTISANINTSIRNNIGTPTVGRASFSGNLISNAYVSKPVDPVFAQDGSYFFDNNVFEYLNPYAVAQEAIDESETLNQIGNLRADFEVMPGLTIGWFGSWRKREISQGRYDSPLTTIADARESNGQAWVASHYSDEKQMDMTLNYDNAIGPHRFSGLAAYEWQSQVDHGNNLFADGFFNDLTSYHAMDLGTVGPGEYGSYKNERKLVSFFGRGNYAFDNKYLFTATVRRDGSSVFGEDHKWGIFPSASIGWRITEEAFMSDIDLISSLKLRVEYGITGNQSGLGPLNSKELVSGAGRVYFGGELINQFQVNQNANPNLGWEERRQMNMGLDFGFNDNRLTGTLDVYRSRTTDLIFGYSVPQPPFPHGSIQANVGEMENEGLEISLDYLAINSGDLQLSLTGNISFMRNEVISMSGSIAGVELVTNYAGWGPNNYLIEGRPIGQYNILRHTGINENGEETVSDINNDGNINQSSRSEDRYFAGQATPTYTFAFTPRLMYKNLDFSMVLLGQGGNKIYNGIKQSFSQLEILGRSNVLKSATELGLYTTEYGSDLWLEDGDFVRLNNVTIGYTISDVLPGIRNIRVSATGRNLHVFTGYSGLDPEVGWNGSGGGFYPRTTSITMGLEVIF